MYCTVVRVCHAGTPYGTGPSGTSDTRCYLSWTLFVGFTFRQYQVYHEDDFALLSPLSPNPIRAVAYPADNLLTQVGGILC